MIFRASGLMLKWNLEWWPHQFSLLSYTNVKGLKTWTHNSKLLFFTDSLIGDTTASSVVSKQKGSSQFSKTLSNRENLDVHSLCILGWPHKCHGIHIGCLDKVLSIFYFVIQCLRTHTLIQCQEKYFFFPRLYALYINRLLHKLYQKFLEGWGAGSMPYKTTNQIDKYIFICCLEIGKHFLI